MISFLSNNLFSSQGFMNNYIKEIKCWLGKKKNFSNVHMCKNNVGSVLLPQCEGSWVWTWQIKKQLLRFSQVMAPTFKKWFHSNYCSNLFTANRITDHWFYQPNVTWATLSWCFKCYPTTERRANTQNISFRNFLGQLIHICNSVDTIKLSFYNPIWHSTTDSFFSYMYFPPFILDTRPLLTLGCVWCVISSLFGYIAYTLPHVSHYTSPGR